MKYLLILIFITMTNFAHALECRTVLTSHNTQNQYITTYSNGSHYIEHKKLYWRNKQLKKQKTMIKEKATYNSFGSYGVHLNFYSSHNIKLDILKKTVTHKNQTQSKINCL